MEVTTTETAPQAVSTNNPVQPTPSIPIPVQKTPMLPTPSQSGLLIKQPPPATKPPFSEAKPSNSQPSINQPSTSSPSVSAPTFKKPSPPSAPQPLPAKAKQAQAKKSPAKQRQAQFSKPQPNKSNGQAENVSAAVNNVRNKKDLCKIEVSGYPSYVKAQDLYQLFCNYGDVRVEFVGKNYSVLCFSNVTEAECAVADSTKVYLYGQFLTVKAFSGAEEFKKQNIQSNKTAAVELIPAEQLALVGSFSEQLGALLAAVRLTQEEVGALAALYSDVERVLQAVWPGCQAMPFGSLTTGLGVKSSDADCFVNIPPHHRFAQASYVSRARRVLHLYPQLFGEVVGIPRANTPIVKLLHLPTRTRCDLSFKTPLGALNSKLVAFLLHADPRLVPAAVTLKYWAATHRISGTGKLTNYALTLLLLFYLQHRGVLPPVEALQRDPAHCVLVDGWNSGFSADYSLLPRPTDEGTVADIIGGFFAFYAAFDFEELAVCPFLGRPVKKAAFLDHNLLPEEFERYRRNVEEKHAPPIRAKVPLCVQDPFEQSHNVASAVTVRLAADVKEYIKFAAETYEKEKATGCRGLLRTILTEKPLAIRSKSYPEYRVSFYPRVLDPLPGAWRKVFTETAVAVFERILKLKLTPEGEDASRGKRERERFSTMLAKPLWRRKRFARLYEYIRMPFMDKQARITEEMINVEQPVAPVDFTVTMSYCEKKVRSAWIQIRMISGELDPFRAFGKYFVTYMQGLMVGALQAAGHLSPRDLRPEAVGAASNVETSDSDAVAESKEGTPEDTPGSTPKNAAKPGKATERRTKEGSPQVASALNKADKLLEAMEVVSSTEPLQVRRDESPMVVESVNSATVSEIGERCSMDVDSAEDKKGIDDPAKMESECVKQSNGPSAAT